MKNLITLLALVLCAAFAKTGNAQTTVEANIGLGISSPSEKLEVRGALPANFKTHDLTGQGQRYIATTPTGEYYIVDTGLPDTLVRGDIMIITNTDSTFYILEESDIAPGAYNLVDVERDSAALIQKLQMYYINAAGAKGEAMDVARRKQRTANQVRWLLNELDKNVNVNETAKNAFISKLQGTYILQVGKERTRLDFNNDLVARDGDKRYRLRVHSISDLYLIEVGGESVEVTTSVINSLVVTWEGETEKGDRVILRKIK